MPLQTHGKRPRFHCNLERRSNGGEKFLHQSAQKGADLKEAGRYKSLLAHARLFRYFH
jgi:hypothetical protein